MKADEQRFAGLKGTGLPLHSEEGKLLFVELEGSKRASVTWAETVFETSRVEGRDLNWREEGMVDVRI